jgi:hypothetical protein
MSKGKTTAAPQAAAPTPPAPKTPPATDPLRDSFWDLPDSESSSVAATLFRTTIQRIGEMDPIALQRVAQFVDVVVHGRGCSTPAEDFLMHMVDTHYDPEGLTPERIARQLDPDNVDGFRCNFDDAVAIGRRFREHYPDLMNDGGTK